MRRADQLAQGDAVQAGRHRKAAKTAFNRRVRRRPVEIDEPDQPSTFSQAADTRQPSSFRSREAESGTQETGGGVEA